MVVLGLLLVLIALLAVIIVVLEGGDPAQIDLQWFTTRTDMRGIFAAGALTVLIGVLGLSLLINGLKRSRRQRAEVKELKQRVGRKDSTKRSEPARPVTTDSQRATQAKTTDVSSSQRPGSSTGAGTSTGAAASTAAAPTTPVARRRSDDDATDEHFESTPRDQ